MINARRSDVIAGRYVTVSLGAFLCGESYRSFRRWAVRGRIENLDGWQLVRLALVRQRAKGKQEKGAQ